MTMRKLPRIPTYDAVIVGARAAGAATGFLLARAGLKVLILDRSAHGSDTTSTHALMRGGVLQLRRWGLLGDIVDAGTPPVRRTIFQVGAESTPITIKPSYGVDALYAPRRTVLDAILIDAAAAAGAEVRHGVTVGGLERDPSGRVVGVTATDEAGRDVSARARITVGADGRTSNVARWAEAPILRRADATGACAYAYWPGLDTEGYEWFFRPGVSAGAIPTNGGESCIFVGTSRDRFRRDLVADPLSGYLALLDEAAPELLDRLAGVRPPQRIVRFPGAVGHMRQAWGPGWALVGDAGYFKDPITAHGITDALRDAEFLARAVIATHAGVGEASALEGYQATRDRLSDALFTVTDAVATYAWNLEEIGVLLLKVSSSMVDEVEALAALDDVPVLAAAG
jgi:2-polyprenyl-6-methoxyphenol hydroxylase-like FAD-dependent oxidoreductase